MFSLDFTHEGIEYCIVVTDIHDFEGDTIPIDYTVTPTPKTNKAAEKAQEVVNDFMNDVLTSIIGEEDV